MLPADPTAHAEGTPGDYQRALAEGDLAGIVGTFEPDGCAAHFHAGAWISIQRGTKVHGAGPMAGVSPTTRTSFS
jgi:hypothetical protein